MQFVANLIKVGSPVFTKTARGGYNTIEVAYSRDGKVEGKKLLDFVVPETFKAIQNFKADDAIVVTAEKKAGNDGKEYWQWVSVSPSDGSQAPVSGGGVGTNRVESGAKPPPSRVTGSNYETREERAARQKYIVRQSSITAALTLLGLQKAKDPSVDGVIEVAKQFEKYVFATDVEDAMKAINELEDDIPV
jgi:hypothetical protein